MGSKIGYSDRSPYLSCPCWTPYLLLKLQLFPPASGLPAWSLAPVLTVAR